ncbi:hypothetical protein [Priestia aryabhattai]
MIFKELRMRKHRKSIENLIEKILQNNLRAYKTPSNKIRYRFFDSEAVENYVLIREEENNTRKIFIGCRDMSRLNPNKIGLNDMKRIFLYDWTYKNGVITKGDNSNSYIDLQAILDVLKISIQDNTYSNRTF